jgi:RNA polymerase sigma-70 factor (ECF subfamily)
LRAGSRSDAPPRLDRELWRRAAEGDEAAFAELFERHVQAVWNHAYRLTGSWSLAEDLTSGTFLTAWRKRTELTLTGDSALPWLYTVAGNLARTEFRRRSRFQRAMRRVPAVEAERDHADDVAERLDDGKRLRTVLEAVRRLPRAERTAVEMCLLGGVSTTDAAAALGISPVSVRAQISRARKRLRGILPEDQR